MGNWPNLVGPLKEKDGVVNWELGRDVVPSATGIEALSDVPADDPKE